MAIRVLLIVAIGAAVLLPAPVHAQTPPSLAQLLARPLSPGSVALLIGHVAAPGVPERLSEALTSAQPEVRAAAARVILAGGLRAMAPQVADVLGREISTAAALEETAVVATFGGSAYDPIIQGAWSRLGRDYRSQALALVARARGPAALDALPAFRALEPSGRALRSFLFVAVRGDAALLNERLTQALEAGDAGLASAFVAAAREERLDLTEASIEAALRSELPGVRMAAAWYVLQTADRRWPFSPRLRAALPSLQPEWPERADDRFAIELLARVGGQPPRATPLPPLFALSGGTSLVDVLRSASQVRQLLSASERRELGQERPTR